MPEAERTGGGPAARAAAAAAPGLFVVLWATGFIGARLTMPDAEPMTTLTLRLALAAALLSLLAAAAGLRWSARRRSLLHLAVAGLLIHAVYLGGVFAAVRLGLEAGASALIVGVQPVVTAAFAGPVLGERVGPRKWLGLGLGVAGVILVVWEKLAAGLGTPAAIGLCTLSLVAIALGSLYQKRFCAGEPIVTGTVVQYVVSAAACGIAALLLETGAVRWSGSFLFGLAWLVLVLSCGAVMLLFWLIRRGAAANVASLFFLVPPTAALMGGALFGETMGATALAGMALATVGVALVNSGGRRLPADGPAGPRGGV